MTRTEAIKKILNKLTDGGLPRAIEIYNYLTCYGDVIITDEAINRYFKEV